MGSSRVACSATKFQASAQSTINVARARSTVLLSGVREVSVSSKNPMMTFPIKRRTNTDQIIDGAAACYIGETRISDNTNEGDQRIGIS